MALGLHGMKEGYVDLSKTILVVRAKVTKANGDDLDAEKGLES